MEVLKYGFQESEIRRLKIVHDRNMADVSSLLMGLRIYLKQKETYLKRALIQKDLVMMRKPKNNKTLYLYFRLLQKRIK